MDRSLLQVMQRSMEQGENVLWIGRPVCALLAWRRLPVALGGLAVILLFTISPLRGMFDSLSGSISGTLLQARSGGRYLAEIFSAIITINALFVLAPVLAFYKGARTFYAVTDRRLLKMRIDVFGRCLRETRFSGIVNTWCEARPGGAGWLHLIVRKDFTEGPERGASLHSLAAVPDVLAVHRLVADRVRQAWNAASTDARVHDYLDMLAQGKRWTDGAGVL